jgi:hypothetical protein
MAKDVKAEFLAVSGQTALEYVQGLKFALQNDWLGPASSEQIAITELGLAEIA